MPSEPGGRSASDAPATYPGPVDYEHILTETDGPVGIITLNRPQQLNALSEPLMRELVAALDAHGADPNVQIVLLTGGPKAFAAGADLKAMANATVAEMVLHDWIGLFDRVRHATKPTIAAVAGYALGGGCELAMACDLIVAADNARFGQPEINVGLIPGAGGTQRLTRTLGKSLAMDMILTGRQIGAEEALSRGLVARVYPAHHLRDEALSLAREIATKAPIPIRLAREAVNRAFEGRLDDGMAYERALFHLLFGTRDAHEGMRAFMEKRPPRFTGA